jgi:hypothetical protein
MYKMALAVTLVFLALNSHGFSEDPKAMFPASKNFTNQTTVRWEAVDNVQAACEKGSHRRGYGGFNYPVEACSFWDKSTCHVITAKKVNFHTLGHEIRHCFQGAFHGEK